MVSKPCWAYIGHMLGAKWSPEFFRNFFPEWPTWDHVGIMLVQCWYHDKILHFETVSHLSTNYARRCLTLVIGRSTLPLRHLKHIDLRAKFVIIRAETSKFDSSCGFWPNLMKFGTPRYFFMRNSNLRSNFQNSQSKMVELNMAAEIWKTRSYRPIFLKLGIQRYFYMRNLNLRSNFQNSQSKMASLNMAEVLKHA